MDNKEDIIRKGIDTVNNFLKQNSINDDWDKTNELYFSTSVFCE